MIFRLFVCAVLVVSFSACSGGGASSIVPTAPSVMSAGESATVRNLSSTPTTLEIPWSELPPLSPEAKEYIINYNLNLVFIGGEKGAVKRWIDFPIPLWADSSLDPQIVRAAIDLWQHETGGLINFRVVETIFEARLTLDQDWPPLEPGLIPWDQACGGGNPRTLSGNIVFTGFAKFAFMAKPASCSGPPGGPADYFASVVAHEMGHTLVLGGHTSNGDVMGPAIGLQSRFYLSPLTKEIVSWLYSVRPGTKPV